MTTRIRVLLTCVVVLASGFFGAWVSAQVRPRTIVDPPIVLSGSDVGFSIVAREDNTPVGMFVVKIDGKWLPVKFGATGKVGAP